MSGARALVTLGIAALLGACGQGPQAPGGPVLTMQDGSGTPSNYLVLFRGNAVASDAITRAGGKVLAAYPKIGVAVVSSADSGFAERVRTDARVEGASKTAPFATRLQLPMLKPAHRAVSAPAPLAFADPLSGRQWNMQQMKVPEALAVSAGSPTIVVADLSTGIDYTHPDLAANIDFGRSVSCVGGVPNQDPAAWTDFFGLGTHSAGTMAAGANGLGIVGAAPGVKVASIRVSDDFFFFPEAIVCGFMWAADHGINVANNPYFADPFLFNCLNDPEQRAVWIAEQRAIRYALSKGVTVVATGVGLGLDLSKRIWGEEPPGVTNACRLIPAEVPGVIMVGATTIDLQKVPSAEYGVGIVDLVAPNADSDPEHPEVQILSSWPAATADYWMPELMVYDDSVTPPATYAYAQGAWVGPAQVAGVAALIQSRFGPMPPGEVRARLLRTASGLPCPDASVVFGEPPNEIVQMCQGGVGQNSFFGSGLVDALKAISE